DTAPNDTAAIDDAVAVAVASSVTRTVYFPKGTYLHDENWQITTADIHLLGDTPGTSVLKKRTNSVATHFLVIDADRVTVENLGFNQNETTFGSAVANYAPLAIFPGADGGHIDNCRF